MAVQLRSRIVAIFALAITCFSGSTLYVSWMSRRIDDRARAIAVLATPSIQHLADARASLRALDVANSHFTRSASLEDREELLRASVELDDAVEAVLALGPPQNDDATRWPDIRPVIVDVDRVVRNAIDGDPGDPKAVSASIDAASDALRSATDAEAADVHRLAIDIEHGRDRETKIALLLDLLSAIAAIGGAFLAIRAMSHHQHVVDERNSLAARRADELEQFAGRVAHDVLGPLASTRLNLEVLATDETADVRAVVRRGLRGIERVTAIVDGLLRFARAGARPDPGATAKLDEALRSVVADLGPEARAADIELLLDPPLPCSVPAHPGVIASVVENLVRNAIKYMGERPVRKVEIAANPLGDRVRIEVRDTGPGIPPSIVNSIFDPHVRADATGRPGIGLGLATVKRIAEAHGGSCGVRSAFGDGSVFWVELALTAESCQASAA